MWGDRNESRSIENHLVSRVLAQSAAEEEHGDHLQMMDCTVYGRRCQQVEALTTS